MPNFQQQIGLMVKEKRKEKKMTQADLARAVGVTQSTISQMEKNILTPTMTVLVKVSHALGTTPSFFLTLHEDTTVYYPKKFEGFLEEVESYYNRYEYEKMGTLIQQAEEEKCCIDDPHQLPWVLMWKAKYLLQTYQLDKALFLCFQILDEMHIYLSNKLKGEIHRVLGDIYYAQSVVLEPIHMEVEPHTESYRNCEEALFHYRKGYSYLHFENKTSDSYKKILYGIGASLQRMGEDEGAQEYYEKCIRRGAQDMKNYKSYEGSIHLANAHVWLGRKDYGKALFLTQKALMVYEEIDDFRNQMTCHLMYAEIYEDMKNIEQAQQSYQSCYDVYLAHPEQSRLDFIQTLKEKGFAC
ncbi:helix-turn-helix domain-containing protein [Cytobacillus sp. FJAT-54145]|uniref:Helix-turn-helix domain-containing protein n=1 Tax=Cytobacillus spartinae TaxID=3299023 RepID=A0ABW6KAQ4_9BACI